MVKFNEEEYREKLAECESIGITSCGSALPKVDVTGVSVPSLPLREQVTTMVRWAQQRVSKVVCVANVHMLMESRHNLGLRSVLANADLVTPDGMPLVWMMRSLGASRQDRVAGMDIFEKVCQQCEQKSVSVYLIGSTQAVLEKIECRLREEFPSFDFAGIESRPFRQLWRAENDATVERINRSGAGVTFISLGCPKQEQWMAAHAGRVHSVMIGVGAVFPVYARVLQHAPEWIRSSGLEWLYRWLQEPRRLSGRYLKTIPPFIYFALRQVQAERLARTFRISQNAFVLNVNKAK